MQWKDAPHLDKQGLFIVGHARSGTTVLLRALNANPDIYLLGEAHLFSEGLKEGFSAWYNLMQESTFQNPRSKSGYCPFTPDAKANGVQTVDWLSRHYRFIGEKMALRSTRLGYNTKAFFDFQATYFPNATYLCLIRHPFPVLSSNLKMFAPERPEFYSESYIHTLYLISEIYATFRNVLVLSHEQISEETFSVVGGRLELDMTESFLLYNEQHHNPDKEPPFEVPFRKEVLEAYALLTSQFSFKTLRTKPGPDYDRMQLRLKQLQMFAQSSIDAAA